jgi:hypothetical protein
LAGGVAVFLHEWGVWRLLRLWVRVCHCMMRSLCMSVWLGNGGWRPGVGWGVGQTAPVSLTPPPRRLCEVVVRRGRLGVQ